MNRRIPTLLATLGLFAAAAMPASALTPGFVAEFESNLHGFGGGSSYTNPATGGVGGGGYLEVANAFESQLGARTENADLTGNYTLAGVTGVTLSLTTRGPTKPSNSTWSSARRSPMSGNTTPASTRRTVPGPSIPSP